MTDLPHTDTLKGPDRVWLDWPGANRGEIVYDEPPERDTQPCQIGYVRADLHAALAARVIEQDAALAAKDARIAVLEEALIRISIEAKGTGIPNESLHVVRTVAIAALEDGQ